jgi:hypothetical protein
MGLEACSSQVLAPTTNRSLLPLLPEAVALMKFAPGDLITGWEADEKLKVR